MQMANKEEVSRSGFGEWKEARWWWLPWRKHTLNGIKKWEKKCLQIYREAKFLLNNFRRSKNTNRLQAGVRGVDRFGWDASPLLFFVFLMFQLWALIIHKFQHSWQVLYISLQLPCQKCHLEYRADRNGPKGTHSIFSFTASNLCEIFRIESQLSSFYP